MDLRWVTRDGVPVLQKYLFVRNEVVDGELVAVYEWTDVPTT